MKWALKWLTTFTCSIIFAVFVGLWLDQKFHSSPLLLIALILYVILGSFYKLWKELSKDG